MEKNRCLTYLSHSFCCIWAASRPNQQNGMYAQRRLRSTWASAQSDQSLRCPQEDIWGPELSLERTAKPLIRQGGCPGWSQSSLGTKVILLVLSWSSSFYFVSLASTILISVISRRFISWISPRKRGFLFIHARVCLSPFIMSYCRRVVIPLSFTTIDASHCSYSLVVGPREDVRVVSSMVNGYADIYKDNRRKIWEHIQCQIEEYKIRNEIL